MQRGTEGVSTRVYLAGMKVARLRESLDSCGTLPCLPSIKTFQVYVVSHRCALHRKHLVLDLARHMPYTTWSQVWLRKVKSLEVDGMLWNALGVTGF